MTRDELIALCERARVPQSEWRNRDSADAQRQLGEAWALLSAGCEFQVLHEAGGLCTDDRTIWLRIRYEGFNFHDGYCALVGDDPEDFMSEDTAYIPTPKRLDEVKGGDWY